MAPQMERLCTISDKEKDVVWVAIQEMKAKGSTVVQFPSHSTLEKCTSGNKAYMMLNISTFM